MKKYKLWIMSLLWAAVIFPPLFLTGCEKNTEALKKVRDIEYVLVGTADVPLGLLSVIEERKERPFRVTYRDEADYYVAVGYGQKPTAGYEILIQEVCETDRGIFVKTSISGPEKSSHEKAAVTCPYIVLKMKYTGEKVIFET